MKPIQGSSARRLSSAPVQIIERQIYSIRNQRIMLDRDLAGLYGVKPIALRQQVKRNPDRFPKDFFFRLSSKETEMLVSQNVIPSRRSLGGSLPYAFTEQGVAMLSSVLTGERAAKVNVAIMRTFVKLREVLAGNKELADKLEELELKCDSNFRSVFDAIRRLTKPPLDQKQRRIGFITGRAASSAS